MKSVAPVGQFEQVVLTAVLALAENAYGVTIHAEVGRLLAPKPVSLGAVYVTLDRLEEKTLITVAVVEPDAQRGGRSGSATSGCRHRANARYANRWRRRGGVRDRRKHLAGPGGLGGAALEARTVMPGDHMSDVPSRRLEALATRLLPPSAPNTLSATPPNPRRSDSPASAAVHVGAAPRRVDAGSPARYDRRPEIAMASEPL